MNSDKIRELNDNLRQNIFNSGKDKVMLSQFVSHLIIGCMQRFTNVPSFAVFPW